MSHGVIWDVLLSNNIIVMYIYNNNKLLYNLLFI